MLTFRNEVKHCISTFGIIHNFNAKLTKCIYFWKTQHKFYFLLGVFHNYLKYNLFAPSIIKHLLPFISTFTIHHLPHCNRSAFHLTSLTWNETWEPQASYVESSRHSMNIISHTESSSLKDWELLEKHSSIWCGDPQILFKWKRNDWIIWPFGKW